MTTKEKKQNPKKDKPKANPPARARGGERKPKPSERIGQTNRTPGVKRATETTPKPKPTPKPKTPPNTSTPTQKPPKKPAGKQGPQAQPKPTKAPNPQRTKKPPKNPKPPTTSTPQPTTNPTQETTTKKTRNKTPKTPPEPTTTTNPNPPTTQNTQPTTPDTPTTTTQTEAFSAPATVGREQTTVTTSTAEAMPVSEQRRNYHAKLTLTGQITHLDDNFASIKLPDGSTIRVKVLRVMLRKIKSIEEPLTLRIWPRTRNGRLSDQSILYGTSHHDGVTRNEFTVSGDVIGTRGDKLRLLVQRNPNGTLANPFEITLSAGRKDGRQEGVLQDGQLVASGD